MYITVIGKKSINVSQVSNENQITSQKVNAIWLDLRMIIKSNSKEIIKTSSSAGPI